MGVLFPFSPLRGYFLGMREARERTSVTETELNHMKALFNEAMQAGAFGISADKNMEDRTEDGGWLPSHVASDEEYLALMEVLSQFGVGHIGWTIGSGHTEQSRAEQRALLSEMMRVSGRPLHVGLDKPGLEWLEEARADGLNVIAQHVVVPIEAEFQLSEYNMFDYMPHWVEPLVGTPEERLAKLSNPSTRTAMKQDVEDFPHNRTDWERLRVGQAVKEHNLKYEGLSVGEIARGQNKHPLDAFLDLAVDEGLETTFSHPTVSETDQVEETMKSPYSHISVSDGGAHTRFLTSSTWPVYFLAHWVRDREVMSLEQAHFKMSALPAWFADFKGRGTLRLGDWADIIVYDLEQLGFLYDKPRYATDFPGEERRMIQKPTGLRYTVVNGAVTFEADQCSGALPGKLLRSYDMVD